MFLRLQDGDLMITSGPSSPVMRVPRDGQFSFVSAIRWCHCRDELLVTAVEHGRRVPDVASGQRGDLALYRCSPSDGVWHLVYGGYGHDPVCLAGGGHAVHRGAGLTFLAHDGSVLRETKVGRFNWGPPSLSVSPDGMTVAWIRWKGDDRKLCLDEVSTGQSRQLPTAVYDYGWLDATTLIYLKGAGPRLLDATTGKTRRFGRGLRDQVRAGMPGATPELEAIAALPADQIWELYDDLKTVGDTVWFSGGLAPQRAKGRATGLFRTDKAGAQTELTMAVDENERIEHFHPLADGSAVLNIAIYNNLTIVDRRQAAIGPLASFLSEGWHPVATSGTPEMGFHALS